MSTTQTLAALVIASLLVAATDSSAQSRRDRRDRSDRGYGRGSDRDAPGTQPSANGAPSTQTRPGTMDDQFSILLKRSIFARNGEATDSSRPPTTTSRPSEPVLSPEQAVVFVGVIAQDDEYVAFAENQTTKQLMILRNGDDVARGKVMGITLDKIAYGTGGAIKEVHLGQNLAGEVVSSSFTAGGSGSTGSTGTSTPSSTPSSPEQAALLERLRQRRLSGQ